MFQNPTFVENNDNKLGSLKAMEKISLSTMEIPKFAEHLSKYRLQTRW